MNISDFINSNDSFVKEAAEFLHTAEKMLKERKISKEQFKELADDILDISRVNELASSIERRRILHEAFNAMKTIVTMLAS